MADRIRVTCNENKYTYVMREDGSTYALRYQEPWIDSMTSVLGNGMTLAFACELEEARKTIATLRQRVAELEPHVQAVIK